MKYPSLLLAGLLFTIVLCSACGQSGDLFLSQPDKELQQPEKTPPEDATK